MWLQIIGMFQQFGLEGLIIAVLLCMIWKVLDAMLVETRKQTPQLIKLNDSQDEIKRNLGEIKTKQDLHGVTLVKLDVRTEKWCKD